MHRGLNQLLLGGALTALAAGAVLTVDSARALNGGGGPTVVVISQEEGGQLILPVNFGFINTWEVVNTTEQTLQIKAIDMGSCSDELIANGGLPSMPLPPGSVADGECAVGKALAAGSYCTLTLECSAFAPNGAQLPI